MRHHGGTPMTRDTHPFLRPLPEELDELSVLALDLSWTWSHAADRLWESLAPEIWEWTGNPWLVLESVSQRRLEELAKDFGFRAELARLVEARDEYLGSSTWFSDLETPQGACFAYFSMEFGLAEALPLYSGGLGILAGDHLKSASDLGVPVAAVGLLYQEGYFRQMLDANGAQLELYPHNVPTSMPIAPVRDADGAWLSVAIELPGRDLLLRVWRAQVGRVPLFLLDSNDPLNSPADRGVTSKLYGGGEEMRFIQQIALGIGGWRALDRLDLHPDVCHLNEGHAAMVTIERARWHMERHGMDFWEALWATRAGNVFTTHTPVAAAFDTYHSPLLEKYGQAYAERLGVEPNALLALGRKHGDERDEAFNMAYLAMRTCSHVNAVSRLHGSVSRRIFGELYPRWPLEEVPVSHITNGVHFPSWDSAWADHLWTETCGKDRWRRAEVEAHAESIACLDDEALWTNRSRERADLVDYARRRLVRQLGQRGGGAEMIADAQIALDPNTLTLGFARRFTEYKRPNLLLHDRDRLARLLNHPERPVQLIVAGKAHPDDTQGKSFVRQWVEFVRRPDVRTHAVFLEDYDMVLAEQLVQGVDVWINTPRRPWEACGTSGMKVLVNGGLNLSALDGWWAEAYSEEVGWALGDGSEHSDASSDAADARQLYELLENQIVPAFYSRDESGVPPAWVARIRASMSTLAPRFSGNRMVRDYVEQAYLPALAAYRQRNADGGEVAKSLRAWETEVRGGWDRIHFGGQDVKRLADGFEFRIQIYLGDLDADSVAVELYAEPQESEEAQRVVMERSTTLTGATHGYLYRALVSGQRTERDYTVRVLLQHREAILPIELPLVLWQR
jgi:starch phosphorylase